MTSDVEIEHGEGEDVLWAIDWTDWLRGATILTSEITQAVETDLVLDNSAVPDEPRSQLFRVSGGTAGEAYDAVSTVTTSAGDTLKASIHVDVVAP